MARKIQPGPVTMLFIGNSFTQRNSVPSLLSDLAAARGWRVTHDSILAGGASLRAHWNAGVEAEAIATGRYYDVVLQEQSTLPVKSAQRMAENMRLFDEATKRAGSKTVLYMTWARLHWPQTQEAIANAYNNLGQELGAIVVPVGLAWQSFLSKHDNPVLHARDQSHPTLAGSYLAACVFLITLLKANPVGIESRSLEPNPHDLSVLQNAAWKQYGP